MPDRFDLSGRVALVTGGGQGIGAAIGDGLAEQGATVVLLDLDRSTVESQAAALSTQHEGRVFAAVCDVRNKEQVERCVADIDERFGRLDILVNNAGIHRRGTPLDYQPQDLADVLAVNLLGAYHMVSAAGRVMIRQASGSIINMSALGGGLMGLGRGGSLYGMTKGGIVALSRDLAAEWGKHGIRVNAVAPGWIRTPMTRALQSDPVRGAKVLERVPLRRWGEAKEVADVVVFLASDAARYVTGCTIPVDGGAANTIPLAME
jgi:gluconate 5-dehydrogenase